MRIILFLWMSVAAFSTTFAVGAESRFFEMRTYYAAPGKLDDLLARFRDHTMALFERHGITNIGYWLPETNSENALIYLLAYPSREAREKSWKEFGADPEWQSVAKASERNGRLVSKVESVYLEPTDFSPAVVPGASGPPRLYELRRYHASPGKLDELLARFRNHTAALFTKHGMSQFGYWVPTERKDGAGETLIYILIHKDRQAWANSFKAFRSDPEWVKVKADSEKNGSLTIEGGVKSTLMVPTDFSPAK
ncbi:MAG TPA: NIPSNAP family protein [Verrucomicrobiae bacterium]|nr:NIPSNAP family protein [Verrucomicrobiae bacterium]